MSVPPEVVVVMKGEIAGDMAEEMEEEKVDGMVGG